VRPVDPPGGPAVVVNEEVAGVEVAVDQDVRPGSEVARRGVEDRREGAGVPDQPPSSQRFEGLAGLRQAIPEVEPADRIVARAEPGGVRGGGRGGGGGGSPRRARGGPAGPGPPSGGGGGAGPGQ